MAAELTVLEVVLSGILAFLAGLFSLLFYYERRSAPTKTQDAQRTEHVERLDQYENQLIGMKIRLDALSLGVAGPATGPTTNATGCEGDAGGKEATFGEKKDSVAPVDTPLPASSTEQASKAPLDLTNHILQLITSKPMTSRDIQITVGRTREHTSRLMKRLAEEGFVKRHSGSRPYTYSITQRGRERLAGHEAEGLAQQRQVGA